MIKDRNIAPDAAISPSKIIGGLGGYPLATGAKYLFVDSNTGSDNNNGRSISSAKATLQGAINACTANKGDVIYIMPGHAETVTSTSVNLSVAGVTVVGLGNGLKRPTFTFSTAAGTMNVSAANVRIINCHFIANYADVAAAFTLAAAKDFVLDTCTFADAGTDLNYFNIVVTGATNNAADGLTVINNYWLNIDAAAKAFISVLGNLDRLTVTDNFVQTGATADAAQFLTMSSKVCLGARILRNVLNAVGATGTTVGIFATGSSTTSTGVIADNRVSSLDTTSELLVTATLTFALFENYYTGTTNASGKLWPVVDAA